MNFREALVKAQETDELLESLDSNSEEFKLLVARKPLLGVPFTLKDSIEVDGLYCTVGISYRKNSVSNRDAIVVQRMKNAGAILLAVTNVPEVCMWWESVNVVYGRTRNPYDSRRISGGSSGGEAALISAAGSVIGIGSDIAGSIRMPCYFNGVFGLKPTPGVVPLEGHLPQLNGYRSEKMLLIGPMCRYAEDLSILLKVFVGNEGMNLLQLDIPYNMKKIRLFYMEGLKTPLAVRYFEIKYDLCAIRLDLPFAHYALEFFLTSMDVPGAPKFAMQMTDLKADINCFIELFKWLVGKSVHTLPAIVTGIADEHFAPFNEEQKQKLRSQRDRLSREIRELLSNDGVLLFPSFPTVAPYHHQPLFTPFNFGYTALWNTVGLPAVQCPMGLNSHNIPLGVQAIGAPGSDSLLITVAQDLEKGFGGWKPITKVLLTVVPGFLALLTDKVSPLCHNVRLLQLVKIKLYGCDCGARESGISAEHAKLLQSCVDLQKRYDILATATGSNGDCTSKLSFVQKLVTKVAEIYDKDLYSDITIHCDGHQFRGHRLVIATRTDYWDDLVGIDRIEFEDIPYNICCAVLKWMYTDHIDSLLGNRYLMQLFTVAAKYHFSDLQKRCELLLLGRIDDDSCLSLYEFATKNELMEVKNNCKKLIKAKWNQFDIDAFAKMSASVLYNLVKSSCEHILHSIIRLRRNDILLLFFVEHFRELPKLCNEEVDNVFPLELALESDQTEIATSLVNHHADVNITDNDGRTLLMRMLVKNKVDALIFLTQNGANFGYKVGITGESLLHIAASTKCSCNLIEWLSSNVSHLDISDVDCDSKTPLMRAVESENIEMVELLLQNRTTDVNKVDHKGRSPISSALFEIGNISLAELIVKSGADLDIPYKGVFLIHYAVYSGNLDALQFLCRHKVDVNKRTTEVYGVLPLQFAVDFKNVNMDLIQILIRSGADISLKIPDSCETLLHHIIEKENGDEILKICFENGGCNDVFFSSLESALAVVDANGNTPIAKAISSGKFRSAELLIKAGADINEKDPKGMSLLMRVISNKLDNAAAFLLDRGVDISERDVEGDCFSLAVEFSLLKTVRLLCNFAKVNGKYVNASLLWKALKKGSFEVAKALVDGGCDLDGWSYNEHRKCRQTLLHKAIGLEMRDAAIFLIDAGCDVDASEQTLISDERSSGDTPLLACIRSNIDDVSLYLIQQGAKLDKQDSEGRTALHLAIFQQSVKVLKELLSNCNPGLLLDTDCYGDTPLKIALERRNYIAAEALIKKTPNLITQVDKTGETLLHKAVKASDLEWVLFLIGSGLDVNVRTQNESYATALHLNAQYGSEIIMRNLILAGADVSATSADGLTPLHVAAYNNHETLCMILLENGAEPNASDGFGNTPLHRAVSQGSVACVNVLIGDSRINLRAVNKKEQNALFLATGDLSRTNSLDTLHMFLSADPNFPLDAKDADGFTVFLLSYLKGNENMCRALLRYGVCLGVVSHAGISVFKHVTPTKQLLFSLLDKLEREPCWADGHSCSECEVKFSLTMRKHHCRHCGRLVCARCSEQTVPILKYGIEKPARVCQICCDILTMGNVWPVNRT
uniref:Uncharacterized protein n=1 Tax=Setaria digitata TaxID=48799 RepID=A0A915Q5C5_9BILA